VGLGVAGPVWGLIADRIGRKPMLVRAMMGGSITVALMALCTTPVQYVLLWFLFGALSGTTPVAIALTASETPREHVGWALGMVTSANSLGSSLGPAVAGLAASAIGLRWTYALGALIEAVAIIPVILMVKESAFKRRLEHRAVSGSEPRGQVSRRILVTVITLLCAQALFITSTQSMQPLLVLRLYRLSPLQATLLSGVAFAVSGAASALAAATYSHAAKRVGFRSIAIGATGVFASAVVVAALSDDRAVLIGAVAVAGLMAGVVGPSISTLLGLETPMTIQATAFGFIATANAFGLSVGPLLGGGVAAAYSPSFGLLTSAGVALLLGLVMVVAVREPTGRGPAPTLAPA
jgi:MFS family permease